MMRSASAIVVTIDGGGSKVCEFVPSGTTPSSSIFVPPMFSARLVIGATVVTTFSGPVGVLSLPLSSSEPQAIDEAGDDGEDG